MKTNSSLIKYFNSGNIKDAAKEESIVYHYTSPEAFLNIIQSGKIRFTDIRYLNDKSETIYFFKILLDFIDKNKSRFPNFKRIVDSLLYKEDIEGIKKLEVNNIRYNENNGFVPFRSDRVFVFCASQESDSLNMWNYYVKNGSYQGYNIGIKMSNLIKTFDTGADGKIDPFVVCCGNVLYDEKSQFKEIEILANELEKIDVNFAVLHLRAYAELQGHFFKSVKFKNEKEYRITVSIDDKRISSAKKFFGANNQKMSKEFYTRGGLIVPALNVNLPKDAISRVYISPKTEYEIAKSSIKELLSINEYAFKNNKGKDEAVKVYKSSIPIRF